MLRSEDVADLSGHSASCLYFKTKKPDRLIITDYQLRNSKYLILNSPNDKTITSRFSCIVDSPQISILAANVPAIIETQLGKDYKVYKLSTSLFTRSASIGNNSYVLRGFDKSINTPDQIFLKTNTKTGSISKEINISEKNNDAGISTDGALHFDNRTNLIIYSFYYKNHFLCLDTNLALVYKGNTIDSFTSSSLKVGSTENIITNTSPKRFVNANSSVSNGYLYNNSQIKADNETNDKFTNNSVIDIYDIKNGTYRESLYIPSYKKEKMSKFRVVDDLIIAFYKNHIVSYRLKI
jgi:hypothetical protein